MASSSPSNTSETFDYRLVLQYVGTRYVGWQSQENGITVQGELNKALAQLAKSEVVKSMGSGRTDTGVHAFGQVVKVGIPIDIPVEGLHKGLNALLPEDINVLACERTDRDFHPIFQAKYKEYNYVFTQERPGPFARPLMAHIGYQASLERLQEAASLFVGTHDFANFYCLGTEVQSTVRTIHLCQIEKHRSTGHWASMAPEYYVLRVVGNGFLKQMVRLIMGSIWNVARGKVDIQDLRSALADPSFGKIAAVAPPEGLYLKEVVYDREYSGS